MPLWIFLYLVEFLPETVLNSLLVWSQSSMTLRLVSGKLSFLFYDSMLLWFFTGLNGLLLYQRVWNWKQLSYLSKTLFTLILTIQQSGNKRLFYVLQLDDSVAQVFGFFYLSCMWLYWRNYIYCISWPLPEVSSVPLTSLFVPPGSLVPWFCHCPCCGWYLCWGNQDGGHYCHIQGDLGQRLHHLCCLISCGCRCCCIQEARAMCAIPTGATRFSGLWAQLPQPWGWDQGHCLCCSPDSTSSMYSNPPTFRYTTMWVSGGLTFWAEKPLFRYRCFANSILKGWDKGRVFCHHDADVTNDKLFFPQTIRLKYIYKWSRLSYISEERIATWLHTTSWMSFRVTTYRITGEYRLMRSPAEIKTTPQY